MPEDVDFLSRASGQIAIAIENALAYHEISELKDKLSQEKLYLEEEIRNDSGFERIIGKSSPLKHILELVDTVAPNDSTVLLLGETGTGKELIARAIHDRGRRKDRTFAKLNCAAIPTGLLESDRNVIANNIRSFTDESGLARLARWQSSVEQGQFSFGPARPSYRSSGAGSWKQDALGWVQKYRDHLVPANLDPGVQKKLQLTEAQVRFFLWATPDPKQTAAQTADQLKQFNALVDEIGG